jgi:polyribonucleotide nucleotidyltransferase
LNTQQRFTAKLGDHEIVVETGLLAQQAGGAVTVRSGDTIVLATATASKEPRPGVDFLPLTVDYEERLYAAGRIPGGFFKREGRPSEEAILLCRLTDRPLRPLFPKGFRNDVQIIVTALSADQENYLDILSIIGASTALMISDIPFQGPVGAVRVGYVDDKFIFNPTASEMEQSKMDLRLAGTADAVLMVEAGADEMPESLMLEAIRQGHEAMQDVIRMQQEMAAAIGKPKREFGLHLVSEETRQWVMEQVGDRARQILSSVLAKEDRNAALDNLTAELVEKAGEEHSKSDIKEVFQSEVRAAMRAQILDTGIRVDGRGARDIRTVTCNVGLLPRAHGSGLFTRGETQALTIATLGTSSDEQRLDTVGKVGVKRYMHHYNFPPYSTGETRPLRGPSRRDVGHGALAERALIPVIPTQEEFPYTIRLVSEVLASNGSSSMASVCGSSLALMDTGVPIKGPVAGAAMGLIKEGDRYAVLTDILGMEDYLGDMDFKVAGTRDGVTALQMDMKVKGIDYGILDQALQQAYEARVFILDKMLETIDQPRASLSPFAPHIVMIKIPREKIGALIGPGGKTIRGIQESTGAKIDVEEDGTVYVSALEGPGGIEAERLVRALAEEATVGKIYTGKVVRTTDFGAFVEILPGTDGLVHISQLADYRVPSVEDVVKVGDEIMVMVIDIDRDGKIKLSRQAVLEGWTAEEARARDRKPSGGGNRGSSGDRRGGGRSGYNR